MRHVTVAGKLWYCVSQFFKTLLNFVTMRRLLSKLINRALLTEPFAPIMDIGAGVHTNALRRLVSEIFRKDIAAQMSSGLVHCNHLSCSQSLICNNRRPTTSYNVAVGIAANHYNIVM